MTKVQMVVEIDLDTDDSLEEVKEATSWKSVSCVTRHGNAAHGKATAGGS